MKSVVRAAGMRGLIEVLADYDVDLLPLMKVLGIPQQALDDEDLRISLVAYTQLLERLSEQFDIPDLGLLMAEHQTISILGPLAIAMQNAATLQEALRVCASHLHTHSPGILLRGLADTPQPGQTSYRLDLITPSWIPRRQVMEQCVADLHHFALWLGAPPQTFLSCSLPHSPLASAERYQSVFSCPMEFLADQCVLVMDDEHLSLSLEGASEQLHRLSLDFLQMAYEAGEGSIRGKVESILNRALPSTRGRRDVVANLLQMHPRTLQRRLREEGCQFQDLLDQVRKNKARHWLTTTDMPLSQIPGQLGLADQTVLNRSCQRWFGQSPGALRRGLQA